jgi:KaiC/GvpD/RAD55 family RecA-like ATPase
MQKSDYVRMPTGVKSLDPVLGGGVPAGSVILLLGDLGAGSHEFVFSSLVNSLRAGDRSTPEGSSAPAEVRYITFTRMKEDVKQEIKRSLESEDIGTLADRIVFDDLSEQYFDGSMVPDEWYCKGDMKTRLQKRAGHENSLVVLDSVTDIATQCNTPLLWNNLTGFLRGLQRVAKQQKITQYLLLSRGILDLSRERELAEIADAVILFKWEESSGARRQRVMYFEKFRGVMPQLEERDLVKFAIRISTGSGFEVSNIRVVI